MSISKLSLEANAVLKANDRGTYTQPAPHLYPHQWLWDSCFTAIGLRHVDIDRAQLEITSLLKGQWHNGMMPNIIFSNDPKYRTDRRLWNSRLNHNAPDDVATSGITQPPMLAETVVKIGESLSLPERRSWYKSVYPALIDYHTWLYAERDPHNQGLVLLIHPWESGLDNSPPWMFELRDHLMPVWIKALEQTHLAGLIGRFRRDTKYVAPGQRFETIEALALFDAQVKLRRRAYRTEKILGRVGFSIEDLAFNSILVRANSQLQTIATCLDRHVPKQLLADMARTEASFEELWDPYAGQYYSRDFMSRGLIKHSSISTLLPLYAGHISTERAAALVKMIEDETKFGPAYLLPSVPLDSEYFDNQRYWQGPTWMNINWLVIDGLERYGYKDHADALRESSLDMVRRSGFAEYFDPLSGDPLGAQNFSWTAALAIDLDLG